MNKIVGIILCLIVAGGAGYYLLQKKGDQNGQYARYLPQDVVATVNLTHLNTLTDTFSASAPGRFVAKDTMHAIMQELRVRPESIKQYDELYDGITQVMNNPAFRAVFGDDAAVAVLPPDRQAFVQDPLKALRSSLVVFATTSSPGAIDLFGRLVMSSAVTRETIDGLQLTRIAMDQNQVLYGYVDGKTVLLAYTPAVITSCVAARKTEKTLDTTAAFKQVAAFWQPYPVEKTYSRVFLNAAKLTEVMKNSENAEVKQSGELLQGVEYMASLTCKTDQGLESRARTRYSYDQLHPLVKSAVDSASKSNQSLHLLQEHSLAYNWTSSLRPELFKQTMAASEQGKQQADAAVRKTFGVSLDELSRAIGPQYGGVLNDIVNAGLFPVPKMTLFLEIRDRKIAEIALKGLRQKIAEYGVASEEQEAVAGNTLYFWSVLPGEVAQPAVVLTDSMFYLATNKQALKDILTGKAAADALAAPVAAQLGPELSKRVAQANFGSFVIYPERMARQSGDVFDWVAGILATTKNISISRLSREWRQLMQSAELMVITTDLTKEQADWAMTLKATPAQPTGK